MQTLTTTMSFRAAWRGAPGLLDRARAVPGAVGVDMIKPAIHRAYRCKDGVIRWAYAQTTSTRNLHIRWLEESTGIWYHGGVRHPSRWPGAVDAPIEEVAAPQVGDEYSLCGPLGTVGKYRMNGDLRDTLSTRRPPGCTEGA